MSDIKMELVSGWTKEDFKILKDHLESRGYKVVTKWRSGLKSIRLGEIVLSETKEDR